MTDMKKSSQNFPWFHIDGEVAVLMRSLDWSACAVGHPETWSPQLLTIVGLVLQSRSPAAIIWGRGRNTFYNDAYAAQLGEKHPASLGMSFNSLWSEIWSEIGPVIDGAMDGKSFYFEDLPYTVEPAGVPTQRWYTSSFSPVIDNSGTVVGIYITASETTRRMQSERRYAFQSELAERLRHLTAPNDISFATSALLGKYLGVGRVVYAAADAAGETISIERGWTDGNLEPIDGTVLRLDDFGPLMGDALRAGQALVTADITHDARSAAHATGFRIVEGGPPIVFARMADVVADPFASPIFLRGSMNGWNALEPLAKAADGSLAIEMPLAAGDYQFKFGSADWRAADFGSAATTPIDGAANALPLIPRGGNIRLTVTARGTYRFELKRAGSAATFTLRKVDLGNGG